MLNILCLTPKHPRADIPTELISLLNRIARVCFCLGSPFGFIRQRLVRVERCVGIGFRSLAPAGDVTVWLKFLLGPSGPTGRRRWNGRALLFTSPSFCAAAGAPACTDCCALPERRLPMDTLFLFFELCFFFFSHVKTWEFWYRSNVLEIIDYKCQSL